MMAFLLNFLGSASLGGALVALTVDGTRSIATWNLALTSLGQTWFSLSRSSLIAFQAYFRHNFESVLGNWLWDRVSEFLLALPIWLVLGLIGAGLIRLSQNFYRGEPRPIS